MHDPLHIPPPRTVFLKNPWVFYLSVAFCGIFFLYAIWSSSEVLKGVRQRNLVLQKGERLQAKVIKKFSHLLGKWDRRNASFTLMGEFPIQDGLHEVILFQVSKSFFSQHELGDFFEIAVLPEFPLEPEVVDDKMFYRKSVLAVTVPMILSGGLLGLLLLGWVVHRNFARNGIAVIGKYQEQDGRVAYDFGGNVRSKRLRRYGSKKLASDGEILLFVDSRNPERVLPYEACFFEVRPAHKN